MPLLVTLVLNLGQCTLKNPNYGSGYKINYTTRWRYQKSKLEAGCGMGHGVYMQNLVKIEAFLGPF